VQVAFYGAGAIAERHIDALRRTGKLDVAWLASRTPEHAQALAAKKGITRWTTDDQAPLGDPAVEAVVIAYPTFRHAELIQRAVAAGKHVVCEKPLAGSAADAQQAADAARAAGKLLLVAQIRRFWPAFAQAHEFVHSGVAGSLLRATVDFQTEWDWSGRGWRVAERGGYMLDMHVHDLDLLLWWLGGPPRHIWGAGENRAEREATVVLEYPDRYARLEFCGRVAGRKYPTGALTRYQLLCERGRMEIQVASEVVVEQYVGDTQQLARHAAVGEEIRASWDGMWGAMAAALTEGAPAPVPVAQTVDNVRVVLAAVDALETRQVQELRT